MLATPNSLTTTTLNSQETESTVDQSEATCAAVAWKSPKQNTVAISTCEAEYTTLSFGLLRGGSCGKCVSRFSDLQHPLCRCLVSLPDGRRYWYLTSPTTEVAAAAALTRRKVIVSRRAGVAWRDGWEKNQVSCALSKHHRRIDSFAGPLALGCFVQFHRTWEVFAS